MESNYYEGLMKIIQQEIDEEQKPAIREKTLTPGLAKAITIIQDYVVKNKFTYQYQLDGGKWHDVINPANLVMLIDMGFNIRRKKDGI